MFKRKKSGESIKFAFECGQVVRDKVTQFEGTITSQHHYLNGCIRYAVQGKVDKDKKVPDAYYFDEAQIEAVEEEKVEVERAATGGDRCDPPQSHNNN